MKANGASLTVYASWNGATEIASWQVLPGPPASTLAVVGSARRSGFETTITVGRTGPLLAARAIDRAGNVLGLSDPVPAPA